MSPDLLRRYIRERPGVLAALVRRRGLRALTFPRRDEHRRALPRIVILRLTHRCNVRCGPCGQWGDRGVLKSAPPSTFRGELNTEQWLNFLRDIATYCPHLYLFGGEPLLRTDALDLIREAHGLRMVTGINTNGTVLAGRESDVIRSGLDYLIVSLDGPAHVHDVIRRAGGQGFDWITDSVSRLIAAKRAARTQFPQIHVCMTVTDDNQFHIARTAQLAHALGVDGFSLQLGIFTTAEAAAASSEAFASDFGTPAVFWHGFVRDTSRLDTTSIAAQAASARALWGPQFRQFPPFDVDVHRYYAEPDAPVRPGRCEGPWTHMQVLPNGDLAFCEDFPDLTVGNITEGPPLAIWNNARAAAFRRRIADEGAYPSCSRCCSE